MKKLLKRTASAIFGNKNTVLVESETQLLALGALLSNQQKLMNSDRINDYEFKIFSQFGDDGIIQFLVNNIRIDNKTFVEFGVENYLESNTRFLMMHSNWSGFVMDGSEANMDSLRRRPWYWKHALDCQAIFIDRDNINGLMEKTGFRDLGLLHIDLDGNDYHILEAMDLTVLNPSILIMEYNAVFGSEKAVTVPYAADFYRTRAHFSNLFYGASLPALDWLARKKGYRLVACNEAGNNAYFVREDLLNEKIKEASLTSSFRAAKFRESRDKEGRLTLLGQRARQQQIRGMEVLNVLTGELEKLP